MQHALKLRFTWILFEIKEERLLGRRKTYKIQIELYLSDIFVIKMIIY